MSRCTDLFYIWGPQRSAIPAPLMLCFVLKFDLVKNTEMCPTERNALKKMFDSTKGSSDWTNTSQWLDSYGSHCDWHGVKCNDSKNITELNLTNNGLAGTLGEEIGGLSFLEVLDLSDNDLKVGYIYHHVPISPSVEKSV